MNSNQKKNLENIKYLSKDTLFETLGMECLEAKESYLILKIPISQKISRPGNFLHGGASAALAESAGSLLSWNYLDKEKYEVVGLEISCNHLKSKKISLSKDAFLLAKASFIHKGKTTHIIEIKIYDEEQKMISFCKMTNLVLEKKQVNN